MHDPLLRRVRDVPHPLQDQPGAIGKWSIMDRSVTPERTSTVSRPHSMPATMSVSIRSPMMTVSWEVPPQEVDARPHHQRIGLADVVGLLPRPSSGAGGPRRGATGRSARAGQVAVGANEPGAFFERTAPPGRYCHRYSCWTPPRSHSLGETSSKVMPCSYRALSRPGSPMTKARAPRHLGGNKLGGGQGTGVKCFSSMSNPIRESLACSSRWVFPLLLVKNRKSFFFPLQPVHKFPDPGQQTVAVVDHAIHVTDESLFIP